MKRYRVANPGKATRKARGEWKNTTSAYGYPRYRKASAKSDYKVSSGAARGRDSKSPRARATNPAKKRLTLKQKLHFGTARQRAAARAALSGKRRYANTAPKRTSASGQGRKQFRPGGIMHWLTKAAKDSGSNMRGAGSNSPKAAYYSAMSKARREKRAANPSRSTSAKSARKRVNRIYRTQGMGIGDKFAEYVSPKNKYKRASSAARGRLEKAPAFRTGNPAQIITLTNPGTTRKRTITNMANKRVYRRKRATSVRRRRNPGMSLMQAGRPAQRRMSASRRTNSGTRRNYRRTRNAGVLSGGFGSAFGIIGGGVLTSLISSKLPAGLNTGVLGYVSTAAVAIAQGTIAGKVFKNPALGKSMTIGGFVYLALRLVQDFVPSLSLPFKLGAIANSSFYTPQVPMGNSMTSFMTPPGVQQAIMGAMPMAGAGGMGRVGRVGRVR